MAARRDRARSPAERPPPDAWDAVVRLLAVRPHSAVELQRKLRQRRCPPEAVEAAIARAQMLGYQSDADFAETLVRSRAATRGRLAVAADLARRGVDRVSAGEALAQVTEEDELTSAARLAARMPGLDPAHLGARLQRRGFRGAVVREMVRQRRAEAGEDDDA